MMTTSMIDATNAIPIPDQDAMLSGTSEKLMMPSNAYFSSFQKFREREKYVTHSSFSANSFKLKSHPDRATYVFVLNSIS